MTSFQVKHLRMKHQCERAAHTEKLDYVLEFPGSSPRKPYESPLSSPRSSHQSVNSSPFKTVGSPESSGNKSSRFANWFEVTKEDEIASSLPWEEKRGLVKPLNSTNVGLVRSHLSQTSSKAMNAYIEEDYQLYKSQKKSEKEFSPLVLPSLKNGPFSQGPMSSRSDSSHTSAWWKNQGESRVEIRQRQLIDHYDDLHSGTERLNIPKTSNYFKEHSYDDFMREMCKGKSFDNHHHFDDMKLFHEAYLKHRSTLRK